jgi:hypothetical protein
VRNVTDDPPAKRRFSIMTLKIQSKIDVDWRMICVPAGEASYCGNNAHLERLPFKFALQLARRCWVGGVVGEIA